VRLSLAGADWPNIWPPPARATLSVDRASLSLSLPVVAGEPPVTETPSFAPPPTDKKDDGSPAEWRIEHDVLARETRAVIAHGAEYDAEHGARVEERYEGAVGVSTVDPAAAWARATSRFHVRWPDADVTTEAKLELRSDAETYRVAVEVIAEDEDERRERRFERVILRDLQ
jgi:hypothetical protein